MSETLMPVPSPPLSELSLKWSQRFLELALSFKDPQARALAFHLSHLHTSFWATWSARERSRESIDHTDRAA